MPMEYDDIIVGAGSAGAVLAARLSEDAHRSVLLLEAGPDYPTIEQLPQDLLDSRELSLEAHDWGYTATALPGRQITYERGKVTGGSSAVNATVALRGVPADYDAWAALGNAAWSWAQVLPYFRKLEDDQDAHGDLHGQGGPIPICRWKRDELPPVHRAFIAACRNRGFQEVADHNLPDAWGVGPWPMNRRGEVRISTSIAYLDPARHRLNLSLRPHCLVHRVVLDDHRAVAVEVESGGVVQRVAGGRVTLAAGAVASPAILLRSGIGPGDDLRAVGVTPRLDLPGVGANLLDHPGVNVPLRPTPAAVAASTMWTVVLLWTSAPDSQEPGDLHLLMRNPRDVSGPFGIGVRLMQPLSRGRLALTSPDPQAPPRIDLNFLAEGEDVRRLVAGVHLATELARSPALAPYVEQVGAPIAEKLGAEAALADHVRRTVVTYHHPVGTARMGPEGDTDAVVDQYCRVWGVEGLRVVDASVMPTIPRANTNLTCIMIGERVADWMRAEA